MTRWFRRVARTWRKQRQKLWRQQRRGEVGAPLVQYHLTAARYQPRLERQERRRRRDFAPEFLWGTPPAGTTAPNLGSGILNQTPPGAPRGPRSAPPRPRQRLRRLWVARLPERTQKGRFVWNERKHPLLSSSHKEHQREKRRRGKALRHRFRQRLAGGPKARPQRPTLLPQPGATNIPAERLQRWRTSRQTKGRLWWARWREQERWYWRLCRWAGGNNKGPVEQPERWNPRPRLVRNYYYQPWYYHHWLPFRKHFIYRPHRLYYRWRWPWLQPKGLWALQRRLRWQSQPAAERQLRLSLGGAVRRWRSGLGRGWQQRHQPPRRPGWRWVSRTRRRFRRLGLGRGLGLRLHPFRRLGQRFGPLADHRRMPRRLRIWLLGLSRSQWNRLRRQLPFPRVAPARRRAKPAHRNRRFGSFRRYRYRRGKRAFDRWRRRRRRLWRRQRGSQVRNPKLRKGAIPAAPGRSYPVPPTLQPTDRRQRRQTLLARLGSWRGREGTRP